MVLSNRTNEDRGVGKRGLASPRFWKRGKQRKLKRKFRVSKTLCEAGNSSVYAEKHSLSRTDF
jgi:hypothetical protein